MTQRPAAEPARVVMIGDSITDARRTDSIGPDLGEGPLGDGYVAMVARALGEAAVVVNRGTDGDRLVDLAARWDDDVLAQRPDVLSVAVGINDTARRFDAGQTNDVGEFEERYDALLAPLVATSTAIVLVEPFVIVVDERQRAWLEDLDARVAAIDRVAQRAGATVIPACASMTALADELGAGPLSGDGVHPTSRGHEALADLWLAAEPARALLSATGR